LAALMSVPATYAFGLLTFPQLVVVAIVMAAANIVFTAASGACLKALVRPEDLLAATSRFETTTWTATVVGPPAGGAAIGMFGPLTTVVANAISFLLSALGIRAIGGHEPQPPRTSRRFTMSDVIDGWRYILRHPRLRPLFFNTSLVNGLIMATSPLLAVLLLREMGFSPWQYGLAFGIPCIGGLIGSRLARPLAARFGRHQVMLVSGIARVCWPMGLVLVQPGPAGLLLIIAIEFGLITSMGIFNPLFAAYRLEHTDTGHAARTLSAWSITSGATIAVLTFLWGIVATVAGTRAAIGIAGVLILGTAALLPRSEHREHVAG